MLDTRNLSLEQIKEILGLEDSRSVKKWLSKNGIAYSSIGRKHVVNEFMFEFKRQQLVVEELKIYYPNNWFKIYEANTSDVGMVKAIRELYPEVNRVKRNNSSKRHFIE